MTDEERQRLCEALRGDCWSFHAEEAANEIERLADERDQFVEQLVIRSESGMAKDMQEIMRRNNEQADELARLAKENEELKKTQLTFRTIERQPFTINDEP